MQREINGRIVYFTIEDNTILMEQMRYQALGPWILEIVEDLYFYPEVSYG